MSEIRLSFEFFPPRNDAQLHRFRQTLSCLKKLKPEYISVTWGALGSASQASLDVLEVLMKAGEVPVAAHLTCSGQTESQILALIQKLESLGITRFVALRGDASPSDAKTCLSEEPHLRYAADLVKLLAQDPSRDISVAAYPEVHPEASSPEADLLHLKEKLEAGATRAITQFFFDADTFLRFRDRAIHQGITQTLVPGILPIHDIGKVSDFAAKCGATVPRQLFAQFAKATDAQSRKGVAVEQCIELCQKLRREGVDEFHLYTLNQSTLVSAVGRELLGKPAKEHVAA